MQLYRLQFVAAIPVGHRVALTRYELKSRGWLSGPSLDGAVVRDLTTGIVYGPAWVWRADVLDQAFHYSEELAEGVRALDTIEGKVTACQVVSRTGNAGNHRITTMLAVAESTG